MPLFFVISGMLFRAQSLTKQYLVKQIRRYILPYFLFCTANLIIQEACIAVGIVPEHSFVKYIAGILYSRGSTEWMPNCSPLWFLTCMFIVVLLYQCISSLPQIYRKIMVLAFLCIGLMFDWLDFPKLLWNIDTSLVSMAFIEFGRTLKEYILTRKKCKSIYCFIGLMGLLFLGYYCICKNPIDEVNFDNNSYGNPVMMLIGAMSISAFVIILCKTFFAGNQHRMYFLSFLGKHTILIMAFDYFCTSVAEVLLKTANLNLWIVAFLIKVMLAMIIIIAWKTVVNTFPERLRKYFEY